MRIVLDLQGAQSESRVRGIGRYSLALALGIARHAVDHEVIVALNGRLLESIEPIRAAFDGVLPQRQLRVWQAPGPVAEVLPDTARARAVAELIREAYLASLEPDIVHVSSLFEGFGDEAITSIGALAPQVATAVTLYDLIPLSIPHPDPAYAAHYQRKLESLRRASLWLGISRYSCDEAIDALGLPDSRVINISCAADARFRPVPVPPVTRDELLRTHGIERPFICSVGAPEDRKNVDLLFRAFASLAPELRRGHQVVLVGQVRRAEREAMERRALESGLLPGEIVFTGQVSDTDLVLLYNTCSVFVFPSLYEGFGLPALEAMQCGAPVLASNATSVPEVVGLADAMFDPRSVDGLASSLARVLTNDRFRERLVAHGLHQARGFSWDVTARRALEAMEAQVHASRGGRQSFSRDTLITSVAEVLDDQDEILMIGTAAAIAHNHHAPRARQMFVDVSELVHRDAGTGAQRVTRSILRELLRRPPDGWSIEAVYATSEADGYRYARQFTREQFGVDATAPDQAIEFGSGDIFFGLDLQHHVALRQAPFYRQLRACGVGVYFLVHDLLPILLPQYFAPGTSEHHARWLSVIAEGADGIVCISRVVADELLDWMDASGPERMRPLRVGWSHSGFDIVSSGPTRGLPQDADAVLQTLAADPSFLMVGTVEPRQGHLQTIKAFELLWRRGERVNLVIVGRRGWMVDHVIQRLVQHPQRGVRLFWLEEISDEYLEPIYAACTCLIAASEGEGHGLPLVEAARHAIPILARDLPIFQEIAGPHASYFQGHAPEGLAAAIERWLVLRAEGRHPRSETIACPTWEESADRLMRILIRGEWYATWPMAAEPGGAVTASVHTSA